MFPYFFNPGIAYRKATEAKLSKRFHEFVPTSFTVYWDPFFPNFFDLFQAIYYIQLI